MQAAENNETRHRAYGVFFRPVQGPIVDPARAPHLNVWMR